jgi:serine/threonine protein kinase
MIGRTLSGGLMHNATKKAAAPEEVAHRDLATQIDPEHGTSASQSPIDDTTRLERGTQLGRYIILRELGAGGMGVVYEAFDPELERPAALKMLHVQSSANNDEATNSHYCNRLIREGQALARLSSPYVPAVFDVGLAQGSPYIATELIRGQTLGKWLAASTRSREDIIRILCQAGEGLASAHAAGLIHRDFKPDNVLVGDDGIARVLDFGIVGSLGATNDSREHGQSNVQSAIPSGEHSFSTTLTQVGSLLGTPAYMAPEQHRGEPADDRCDQFSFCVTLFECLTKERPFSAQAMRTRARRSPEWESFAPIYRARSKSLPRALARILKKGLELEPVDRHASMTVLLDALMRYASRRQRWRRSAVALSASALTIAALAPVLQPHTTEPCSGESIIAPVWNELRDARARDRFVQSGIGYAEMAWETVRDGMSNYRERWQEAFTERCNLAQVARGQEAIEIDRQMACLRTQQAAFSELARLLESADESTIRNASDAIEALPLPASCETRAERGAHSNLPVDPTLRKKVERLFAELAQLTILENTRGADDEFTTRLEALIEEAQQLGFLPLLAQAYFQRGQAPVHGTEIARQDHARALAHALADGEDELASRASIEFMFHSARGTSDRSTQDELIHDAQAMTHRAGNLPELRHRLELVHGFILDLRGESAAQLVLYEGTLRRAREHWGFDSMTYAKTLQFAGTALLRGGRSREAVVALGQAAEIRRRLRGESHPLVLSSMRTLSQAYLAAQDYEPALEIVRSIFALCDASYERVNRDCSMGYEIGVQMLLFAGFYREAQAVTEAASKRPGAELFAMVWSNLEREIRALREDSETFLAPIETDAEESIVARRKRLEQAMQRDSDYSRNSIWHPRYANFHLWIGRYLLAEKKLEDAQRHAQGMISALAGAIGTKSHQLSPFWRLLGEIAFAREDYATATEALATAARLFDPIEVERNGLIAIQTLQERVARAAK